MLRKILFIVTVSLISLSCATNAITGRSQLSLVPDATIRSMSAEQYKQFLTSNKAITTAENKDVAVVNRAGNRLIEAIKKYYTEKGLSAEINDYAWEINVVNNAEVNAWCMPGGKMVVYSGILPVTQTETSLAIVLGHEIAHALAKHGNERMSQGLVQQMGGAALSVALSSKPAETQNLFLSAYGIGSNVGVMLPFSRKNELEADKFGLMFAALAGYDPREAVTFWERMAAKSAGTAKQPEFLSTHPADATRIAELKKIMDETVSLYYRKP